LSLFQGIYSLIETAKQNGVEPLKYLRTLFKRAPGLWNQGFYLRVLRSFVSFVRGIFPEDSTQRHGGGNCVWNRGVTKNRMRYIKINKPEILTVAAYTAWVTVATKRWPILSTITLNPSSVRTPKSIISLSSAKTISSFVA